MYLSLTEVVLMLSWEISNHMQIGPAVFPGIFLSVPLSYEAVLQMNNTGKIENGTFLQCLPRTCSRLCLGLVEMKSAVTFLQLDEHIPQCQCPQGSIPSLTAFLIFSFHALIVSLSVAIDP